MNEITENDYNLNIPRYVDTYEEEAAVDLEEVSNKIKDIDDNLQLINTEIAKFCAELNISTPF